VGSKSKSAKIEVAEYRMSIQFGICLGRVDELLSITVGDKVAWSGSLTDYAEVYINKPDLFGGIKKEGGVQGYMHFFPGSYTQTLPLKLAQRLGREEHNCPGFRGIAHVWFTGGGSNDGFYWSANTPYIQTVRAKVRRVPVGLPSDLATITYYPPNGGAPIHDANPAAIIYECLTNTEWGMGASTTMIDNESFVKAAKTLKEEGFGLSMIWTQQAKIQDFISEVIDHIEGTLFINPRTGLITLRLIRGDYDVNSLRIIDPTNATLGSFQRKLLGETVNEIQVTWTNPENEEEETVILQDNANIAMQGGIVSDSRNYYGVRNAELAMRLAARDLRVASAPLATCEATLDRSFWDILPGDVVKVTWPEHQMYEVIMRVASVDYGKSTDSAIKVSLVEDVFGYSTMAYSMPPGSQWEEDGEDPRPIDFWKIFTLPYAIQKRLTEPQYFNEAEYPQVSAAILAAQQGRDTIEIDLLDAESEQLLKTLSPVSRGVLTNDLPAEVTSVDVEIASITLGTEIRVGTFVVIGSGGDYGMEMALVTGVGSGTVTLQRGILDTVPRSWPVGTEIWFVGEDQVIDDDSDLAAGITVKYLLLPRTSRDTLDPSEASPIEETLSDRPWLPLRPANVKFEGMSFGTFDNRQLNLTSFEITWATRNRLTEDSVFLPWDAPSVQPEDGQTTTVAVYDFSGKLLTAHDGLTGESFTLPISSFAGRSRGIVKVTSKRDGLESLQGHEIEVIVDSGYGYSYGMNYGGL